jgi:hypothetical protein
VRASPARLPRAPLTTSRLISASVGTVVHYGFQNQPAPRTAYLALCLLMGLTGSVFPFMAWFNQRRYKVCPLPSAFAVC